MILQIPTENIDPTTRVSIRNFSIGNREKFQALLESETWSAVRQEVSVDRMMNKFIHLLTNHHNEAFPVTQRTTSPRRQKIPRYLIEKRETLKFLQRLYADMRSNTLADVIQQLKQDYRESAEREHKTCNHRKINLSENKAKTMWQIINNETGRDRIKIVHPEAPSSEDFVQYFTMLTQTEHEENREDLGTRCPNSIFLYPTDSNEIQDILNNIKTKTTQDVFELSTRVLKWATPHITEILSEIFNQALQQGHFPERLKIARVTPVFKKGSRQDCANYRPIAVLPALSKILEEIISKRLYRHLTFNNLFTPYQFAYQPGMSTEAAMKYLIGKVHEALEDRMKCKIQLCDLSRAFDTMPHGAFLQKMENYGVRGTALNLISSYLTGRVQQVKINGECSTFQEVKIGVPQGSIMGGIFFAIYMNDLPSKMTTPTILYADDTTLITTAKTNPELHRLSEKHLTDAQRWFQSNGLLLNHAKSEKLTFQMDTWEETDAPVRFLGIMIDARLTWGDHVDYLARSLSKATYAIRRIEKSAGSQAARTAYMSLFHARMVYGLQLWGHSGHTKRILLLQKKAVRSLHAQPATTHSRPLFQRHRIMTVYAAYLHRCLSEIQTTAQILPKRSNTHDHNTREKDKLRTDFSRLATTSSTNTQTNIYNMLPLCWKSQPLKVFQRLLKDYLLQEPPFSIDEFVQSLRNKELNM